MHGNEFQWNCVLFWNSCVKPCELGEFGLIVCSKCIREKKTSTNANTHTHQSYINSKWCIFHPVNSTKSKMHLQMHCEKNESHAFRWPKTTRQHRWWRRRRRPTMARESTALCQCAGAIDGHFYWTPSEPVLEKQKCDNGNTKSTTQRKRETETDTQRERVLHTNQHCRIHVVHMHVSQRALFFSLSLVTLTLSRSLPIYIRSGCNNNSSRSRSTIAGHSK